MEAEVLMAEKAGLIYTDLDAPGYRRRRWGKGFIYEAPDGRRINNPNIIKKLRSLVIPPAWKEVWIFPHDRGHIQATGRDARGRKQYIYHPDWREISNLTKFERLTEFGRVISGIRRQVEKDLEAPDWSRPKVTALAIRLLDETLIRIGNPEYEKANRSFGLTTLNQDHVEVEGNVIRMSFRGKRGKEMELDIHNRKLARMVRKCEELPGQKLFQYCDGNGERQTLGSDDVNEYLQRITGEEFTAKDFRTWGATVLAVEAFSMMECPEKSTLRRKVINLGIRGVAKRLNNTPTVCRKYYVHPKVLEAFESNRLPELLTVAERSGEWDPELSVYEKAVMKLLTEEET